MSFYRKVDPRVHSDRKFRSLRSETKLLWLTLLTHPATMSVGTIPTTISGLAEEMGWERDFASERIAELVQTGMLQHDAEERLLWMPNFLKYNRPENPKVVTSLCAWFEKLPDSYLLGAIARSILTAVEDRGSGFRDAVSATVSAAARVGIAYLSEQTGNNSGYGIRDGLPNGMANQEQEPKQEQEPDPKPKGSTRGLGNPPYARTHEGAREAGSPDGEVPFPLDEVA